MDELNLAYYSRRYRQELELAAAANSPAAAAAHDTLARYYAEEIDQLARRAERLRAPAASAPPRLRAVG